MDVMAQSCVVDQPTHVWLVAFGNPILDMTAVVLDTSLHSQFELPVDGQLEVTPQQKEVFHEVAKQYVMQYSAGGSALNTARVYSWVLGLPGKALFVGGIGDDSQAAKLTDIIHESGVKTKLLLVQDKPTGQCVALVFGAQRCLCADIGAAEHCPIEFVFSKDGSDAVQRPMPELQDAPLVCIEGYFITHSFDTALMVAKFARKNNKTLVFNLCGSYVCKMYPDEVAQLLPFVDLLFGFVEEYKTLEKHVDLDGLAAAHSPDAGDSIVTCLPRIMKAVHRPLISLEQQAEEDDTAGLTEAFQSACLVIEDNKPIAALRKDSSGNGFSDSDDSNHSHYFDNSEVLNDDYTSLEYENTLALPIKPGSRRGSKKKKPSSNRNSLSHMNGETRICDVNGSATNSTRCVKHVTVGDKSDNLCEDVLKARMVGGHLGKVVVLTQGPLPVLYVRDGEPVRSKLVAPLPAEDLVDTTGAGDSFVGGFLAAMCLGKSLDSCVADGVETARHILQQKGCTLPAYPATFL